MKFKLFSEQIKVISEIFVNLGHIFFASGVLPFLFPEIGPGRIFAAIFGFVIALLCWCLSISLIKNRKL